jgi:hypothetical protein
VLKYSNHISNLGASSGGVERSQATKEVTESVVSTETETGTETQPNEEDDIPF